MLSDASERSRIQAIEYSKAREMYEDKAGSLTAARFWKCSACHRKGAVFDEVDDVVGERERLLGIEDGIQQNIGVVNHPIDRPPSGD